MLLKIKLKKKSSILSEIYDIPSPPLDHVSGANPWAGSEDRCVDNMVFVHCSAVWYTLILNIVYLSLINYTIWKYTRKKK